MIKKTALLICDLQVKTIKNLHNPSQVIKNVNLSNFSNVQAQRNNTNLASIEHLQKYITELTLYIN